MDNSDNPEFTVCGRVDYRGSEPVRLCCALTRLSRALATCVPRTEMADSANVRCLRLSGLSNRGD